MTKNDAKAWIARLKATLSIVEDRVNYMGSELEQTSEDLEEPIAEWFKNLAYDAAESAEYWNGKLADDFKTFKGDIVK